MGIFDSANIFGKMNRFPNGIGMSPMVGRFLGGPALWGVIDSDSNLRQRIKETPLHDASIGAGTMREAQKLQDTKLLHLGEAMIASSVIKANNDPNIPTYVRRRVVELAKDSRINPVENPLLQEELASEVNTIMKEHP